MDFSKIKVNITYTDGSTIETGLSTHYMDVTKSDDTSSLGKNKDAVFNFDGKEIQVNFDVVEHPLNLPNKFYCIKTSDTKRRIEWYSKPNNYYLSTWFGSTTANPTENGALYFRPTSWSGDTNKNLYEIYKGSSVLRNTDDLIPRVSLPSNDFDKKAASWQIMNLGDGTYAIISAYNGKAITYSGEENGVPIKTTDFNINNVKEGQRFKLIRGSTK